jgi:hypothetical protein
LFRLQRKKFRQKGAQDFSADGKILPYRYSGLKQRMIGERFWGLNEGLVSRDRRAIRGKDQN